jgi:hypothetical protein
MKKLSIVGVILWSVSMLLISVWLGMAQAASVTFGWEQPDILSGNANFYGWKVWQSPTATGSYTTQFGSDIVWNGTVMVEYSSPAIPITPPAGQETTYYFKLDAWNKPGTSTPLNSGLSNMVSVVFDLKAPTVPIVTPALPATTTLASIDIAGTKEANSSILIGTVEKVALNTATTWAVNIPLTLGVNSFSITSKDAAGNTSAAVVVSITRNPLVNAPPVPTNFRVIVKTP